MAKFEYSAISEDGGPVEGEIDATSASDAIEQLKKSGYLPISATPLTRKSKSALNLKIGNPFRKDTVTAHELRLFTRKLATMLSAGITLDSALSLILKKEKKESVKQVTSDIQRRLQAGESLAASLENHPRTFDRLYISMVQAGETAGAIDIAFERIAEYLDRKHELARTIQSALTYPLILSGIGAISLLILITVVIPNFETALTQGDGALPLSTRAVLAVSSLLRDYWIVMIIAAGIVVSVGRYYLAKPTTKRRTDVWALKLPVLGDLISKIEMSRFVRTLGSLMENGVSLVDGLSIAKSVLSNSHFTEIVSGAEDAIHTGGKLSEHFGTSIYVPDTMHELIHVGEETGQLDEMLMKLADLFDSDIKDLTDRLLAMLEPAIIVVMGVVIGVIVMSILTAVLSLNDMAVI